MKTKCGEPRERFPVKWQLAFGLLLLLLSSLGCRNTLFTNSPTQLPDRLPDTEIMFNYPGGLGFVNADGSNLTYLDFVPSETTTWGGPTLLTATILENNQLLVGLEFFTPFTARPGETATPCTNWSSDSIRLTPDQQAILLDLEDGLAVFNLQDCGTNNPPLRAYPGIHGVLSPDGQYVAEEHVTWVEDPTNTIPSVEEATIIIRSIADNDEEGLVVSGAFPAWSRDSRWLAYTGVDGIYVVEISLAGEPQRIVEHSPLTDPSMPLYSHAVEAMPPAVSWSPDGNWLVYHLHREIGADHKANNVVYQSDYDIYKVNVVIGEESKIIEGGINPFWRWPVQP